MLEAVGGARCVRLDKLQGHRAPVLLSAQIGLGLREVAQNVLRQHLKILVAKAPLGHNCANVKRFS